ncbi:extracellular solute-binding protein [Paenibacillus sp. TRM 82003]|nr:extracellular solute-binding protein [Paenibacillus sp. TRM 82003]
MKKKSLLILAALAMFATACSGGNGGATTSDPAAPGESSPAAETPAPKADTITVWTYPVHGTYEDDLKQQIADYEAANPHINIEYEMLSWAEGPKKFDVALNSGNPPDLYFHSVEGQYVSTGLALELGQFLTDEIKNDYLPGTLELGQIQGKQYGLPIYQYQWAWGGNKRILEEAGVDWKKIQQEGWTWSEFLAIAPTLMKDLPDGSKQYALATDGNGANNDFVELVTRNSGIPDVLDKEGKFQYGDERIVESLTFIQQLLAGGFLPPETAALDAKTRTDMFYAGKAAIISKAIPYYDVIIQNRNKDIDAGKVEGEKIDFVLLPVPYNEKYGPQTVMGGEGYVAFRQKDDKGPEHAQNTFNVMEALSGAAAGNAANELCLPFVRQSQIDLFADKGKANPDNLAAATKMAEARAEPVVLSLDVDMAAKMKQFKEQTLKPNMQALYAGEKSPEAIAEEFKANGQRLFGQ